VRLTVTDSLGQVDTATSTATVTDETPSAAFTIAVRNPESGQAIAFDGSPSRDPDGSISSYAWSFGDGSRAWGPAPTHTYSSPGTYSVTLTVTDSSGQRSSVTQQLTVSRGPTATFTVSAAQLVEGTSVSFDGTASATGGLGAALQSYAWSFGDGATATGPSATHTYTTPGNHTVTLTVSDTAGGRSTASRTIFVADEPPTVAFGTPTGIVVPDQTLTLDAGASTDPDGAIGSYTWSFGDRGTATGRSATHAYANPGTYTVQLTVRDSDGQSATATHTLTVHTQPASNFAFSPALPREGAATTFDGRGSLSSDPGTAIISYLWSFGDGASTSGATATHTYARAGAYPVTLSVTNNLGLTDVSTEQVTVAHGLPTAVISDRPAQPVRGRPVRFTGSSSHAADETFLSYTWRFGDGSSAAGRAPTHTYARAGHFVVSLTVTDSFGDSTTTTSPVTVTRHGLITDVAVRSSRAGATVLVSVNDAGTLTAAHRKLSLNRPGTAAIPVRLSRAQIRALRAKHQVDLRLALRFVPRGGAPKTTSVVVSLRPAPATSGHVAAILIR
jgi:PKD repeat protein